MYISKNYQNDSSFFVCIYYLISVGKNNRYGHPNKEVLCLKLKTINYILRLVVHRKG